MTRIIREIRSEIETIEKAKALYEEASFTSRVEAIDLIEFRIVDRIENMLPTSGQAGELSALKQRAEMLKKRLEAINDKLLRRHRANIESGGYTGADLRRQLDRYVASASHERTQEQVGYDSLDVFVNSLLRADVAPEETKEREPEMVFYQPTPVRIVLELIEKADFSEDDVLYDLGSGLGQVAILVNLLTGVRAKGIEFEPAYCDYARRCARRLNLSRVEFMNVDAREADYSDGTVFFMYTPFVGALLQEVLEKLEGESRKRIIRVYTYGPCTLQVSSESWLKRADRGADSAHTLAAFNSI
ncbi:MAG TPA: hypothetical protein VMY98_04560 [Anaerolineae bacterium]|nr:hypothetical protein [Anaerolineae bacterium]